MATLLGKNVFFHNKEIMSQCNGQNVEPVTIENLVIHFDQEKFEELLYGGNPTLYARKHRRVSVAKTSLATNQKAAPIEAEPATCAGEQGSLQFPPVSTEAKLTSHEAKQVPREPKTAQDKQV